MSHGNFNNEDQFFEESKKLYLSRHNNVVQVNYGCQDDDFVYLAMPFYEKGSLKGITDKRFLTSREIIRYSLQFLSGLHHIHSKGLLHFDIKLANILISKSNQALISDFGLAQYTGNYGFAENLGTTRVLAPPEYFQQKEHNFKFDIFQAGMTMYRMCVGDRIFKQQINSAATKRGVQKEENILEAIMKGKFPDRSFHYPHIPISLRKAISKSLNPNPDLRYESVIDFMNDLANIDVANDWVFETDFNGSEQWTKPEFKVVSNFNGNDYAVETTKNGRRKMDFCKNNLSCSEKNSLIYHCFKTF